MALSTEQTNQIIELNSAGTAIRAIANQLGVSKAQVEYVLKKHSDKVVIETVARITTDPVVDEAVQKNLFDVTTRLQEHFAKVEILMEQELDKEKPAPLKERVALLSEHRSTIQTASDLLAEINDLKTVQRVMEAIFKVFEQYDPDVQQKILSQLRDNPMATTLVGFVGHSRAS